MRSSIIVFLSIFALSFATDLPAFLKTCHRSDSQYSGCLSNTIPVIIQSMARGNSQLKIPSLEPLAIDRVKIGDNSGPVALKQEYHNIKLHGLTNGLRISNYKIDFDRLVLHSESWNPRVDFTADYILDGSVLVLPIRGSGHSNISMINLHSTNDIYCQKEVRNGETYLKAMRYEIKFKPEQVRMSFDNLFDGDRTLADPMNKFIDENAALLFTELQAPYEETFGIVFTKICNQIFSRFPMNKLFPV